MCVVSMITDDWSRKTDWQHQLLGPVYIQPDNAALQRDIESLKAEIEALKDLLKAAKEFDFATGQPDCEKEEKTALLKDVAKHLGVDLSGVL